MPRSPPTRPRSRNTRTNPKVLGFFVGQVMKATGGKANPALVNELLRKKLTGMDSFVPRDGAKNAAILSYRRARNKS